VIIVVLEILVCLVLAGIIGGIVGWFLHRLRVEPANQAMDRLVASLQEAEARLLDVKAESRVHAARAEVLETDVRARAIAAQTLENELSSLNARLSMADKTLAAAARERDEAARELEEVREQFVGACAQAEEARLKLSEQERAATQIYQTVEELKQSQTVSVTALAERSREIDRLLARITELESNHQSVLTEKSAELLAAQEHAAALEAKLGEVRTEAEKLRKEAEGCRRVLRDREAELEELWATLREVEPHPHRQAAGSNAQAQTDSGVKTSAGTPSPAENSSNDEEWDDLKRIAGIGPKLEQLLHGLGVHTFRQVALWSDEEIDRMDSHLKRFRGRIRREQWVERAREEFYRKYGKQPDQS